MSITALAARAAVVLALVLGAVGIGAGTAAAYDPGASCPPGYVCAPPTGPGGDGGAG